METKFAPQAERQREKREKHPRLLMKIDDAVFYLGENPYAGKLLKGKWEEVRSYRVENWRILYKAFKSDIVVLIISISDRKASYR